jgi:hypothetical protein
MASQPSRREFLLTGVVGVVLYTGLCAVSVQSLRSFGRHRSRSTKRFFASISLMSVLELPQYWSLLVDRSYDSRWTYCVHIAAGVFFFLAFSLVARQWCSLLSLDDARTRQWAGGRCQQQWLRLVYGARSLVACNALFALVDVVAIGLCCTAPSLQQFFFSPGFETITLLETLRNSVYASALAFFGLRLVARFYHFSVLERHALLRACGPSSSMSSSSSSSLSASHRRLRPLNSHNSSSNRNSQLIEFSRLAGEDEGDGTDHDKEHEEEKQQQPSSMPALSHWQKVRQAWSVPDQLVFTRVVLRFTAALAMVSLCFLLRLAMLLAKMFELHSPQSSVTSRAFPLFGFWWFVLSDFVPRMVPSLALVFLMRSRKPPKAVVGDNNCTNINISNNNDDDVDDKTNNDNHRQNDSKTSFRFSLPGSDECTTSPTSAAVETHPLLAAQCSQRERLLSADLFEDDLEVHLQIHPQDDRRLDREHVSFASLDPSFQENLSDYSEDNSEDEFNENFGEAAIDKLFSLLPSSS